ncbi:MAG: PEP-CTERM/exosortase system-associated acyltransferase, partial [Cyanobacteria bacterium J083]
MSYCSIAEHFNRYFELVMADTPELKREVYSIRYRVYCEELSYESTDKFPDGLEKDAYDDHSIHYLLKHRPSGLYAGCVRIVLPTVKEDYQPIFPSQAVFPNHFDLIGRHKTEF